jgi:hypothetical protein
MTIPMTTLETRIMPMTTILTNSTDPKQKSAYSAYNNIASSLSLPLLALNIMCSCGRGTRRRPGNEATYDFEAYYQTYNTYGSEEFRKKIKRF